MQRISRAPELSATLSLDSCWIIALPRLLHDVDQAPALGLRERTGLDHADHVALAGLVALVVRVQLGRGADDLLVGAVTAGDVDADGDRFVALAGDDDPLAHLGGVGLTLGRRGAGAGAVSGFRGSALFAPQGRLALTSLGALRLALLRSGGACLARLPPRFRQAPPLLPGQVVLRIGLSLSFRDRSSLSCLLGRSVISCLLRGSLIRRLLGGRGLLRGSLLSRGGLLDRLLGLRLLGRLVFFLLVVA